MDLTGDATIVGDVSVTGNLTDINTISCVGVTSADDYDATGTAGYQVEGVTVIDSDRNLTNVVDISATTGTFSSTLAALGVTSTGAGNFNT